MWSTPGSVVAFELQTDAPRFLRPSVGAAIVLLLFTWARLIGYGHMRRRRDSGRFSSRTRKGDATERRRHERRVLGQGAAVRRGRTAFVMYAFRAERGSRSAIQLDLTID